MKRTSLVALAIVPLLLAGCGGKKRPPAVIGGGAPSPAPSVTPTEPSQAPLPVESGPDVRPVDPDEFSVSDPDTGEGGPLEDVHFDYDESTLTEQAKAILERHALWLQNHRAARVMVEGHCDERGTVEYNLALGERRARAAHDYLVSLGVGSDRLRTTSYGKERPLDPASNEAAWARNRRAHFTVTR